MPAGFGHTGTGSPLADWRCPAPRMRPPPREAGSGSPPPPPASSPLPNLSTAGGVWSFVFNTCLIFVINSAAAADVGAAAARFGESETLGRGQCHVTSAHDESVFWNAFRRGGD
jgi:hypothetical protein